MEQILGGSKTGTYDVFATPWYTVERDEHLAFSQPYLYSSIHFIKKKSTPFEYNRFDDLEGLKIGVVENYAYDEDFGASTAIEKIDAGALTENLHKLLDGKIDLTLDDQRVLRYTLAKSMRDSTGSLEILPKPLVVRGINIGVSRSNPDHSKIVADFDRAIAGMQEDGTYDAILEKHNGHIDRLKSSR